LDFPGNPVNQAAGLAGLLTHRNGFLPMRIDARSAFAHAVAVALIVPLLLTSHVTVTRAADGNPAGLWLTQAGDAKVQVSRCASSLCGKVVWLKEPIDPATGKLQVDDKNQNLAMRTRPIVGIQLFIGMKTSGPNAWSGHIYNADDGKTYTSTVTLIDATRLEVRGCVGPLCGSETWSRIKR
jgi:uncharacterized protein (DUF2147 family)